MAQVNAGRVRFIGRGEYDNSTQYYTFDLVNYNGNSYFAKSNTMGNLPTNSTYWQLVAEKGNVGPAGPTGNGIDHISLTSQSGATKVYTIYFTDGNTTTFTVEDGEVTQEVFDEEVERLKMVYNAMPKVSGEGTDLTLNNTAECPVYDIELSPSELEQETTSISGGDEYDSPSPEHPQEIHTVSGENSVLIRHINMWNEDWEQGYYNSSGVKVGATDPAIRSKDYIPVRPNTNYYYYNGTNSLGRICYYDKNKIFISTESNSNVIRTTPENCYYITISTSTNYGSTYNNNICINVSNANINGHYYPHQEQTYPISLGDLEYCKIGDYEDEFYKATESDTGLTAGKWYLKKNVGKVVLNGSENIKIYTYSNMNGIYVENVGLQRGTRSVGISNMSKYVGNYMNTSNAIWCGVSNTLLYWIGILDILNLSLNDFKVWLSTHNLIVYYHLATQENILLNDTLQTQLDNLWKTISYQGQTNVSQTNADLPFVIKLSAIRDLSGIFEEI